MKSIINVDGLSKCYVKNSMPRHDTLRDRLSSLFKREEPSIGRGATYNNSFWALRDISFSLNEGDVLGILGRNGAGKSTLLKILSRITEPTSGRATIRGRVGSLLEVGTGFHPELTGRENMFLNGAILGMSAPEVQKKFDEIVAFSGVEEFLDTPVKRYSSGMRTRLAFSVAAHLEPEVLIVDEVLSVGDSFFRKKCFGKMREVANAGRTVLFVSHNISAIRSMCNKGIILEQGRLTYSANDIDQVIAEYMRDTGNSELPIWLNSENRFGNEALKPIELSIRDASGRIVDYPATADDDLYVNVKFELKDRVDPAVGFAVVNEIGEVLFWNYQSDHKNFDFDNLKIGKNSILAKIPNNLLKDGDYNIILICGVLHQKNLLHVSNSNVSVRLRVVGNRLASATCVSKGDAYLNPILDWSVQHV